MDCGIYFACLASLCLLHSVSANCVQSLEGDTAGYGQCINGYTMFMANAASSLDPNDSMAMMSILCSTEGKGAMKCLLDYLKTCPELMTSEDPVSQSIYKGFTVMEQFGGLEGYCNMMSGPCMAVQQCLTSQQFDTDNEMMSTPPTPFSMMQLGVKGLCGPLKGMLDCFKDVGNECPELEENIKLLSKNANMSDAPSGVNIPSYEKSKEFVKKCDKIPKDFATNTCVMDNLKSAEFVSCYENITQKYLTQESRQSCDAYRDGHKCISVSIGEKCGKEYLDAFVLVTPMFISVPTTCTLKSNPNRSSLIHVSVATILAALLAVFQSV